MRPHVKQKAVAVSMFVSAMYGDVWHKARNVPVTFFVSLFDRICWLNIWKSDFL